MLSQSSAVADILPRTELHWRSSALVSGLHAAEIVRRDPQGCDPELAAVLAQPVSRLQKTLGALGLPVEKFWSHVVPLSANLTSMRQLADVTCRKLIQGDPGARIATLADILAELDVAFRKSGLDQMDDLAHRAVLLQGRWLAEGQAVLHALGNLTDPELIVERAEVLLVTATSPDLAQAARGVAHLPYNSVRVEAVEDILPDLPHTVRLAWLIAQLNLEVPRFSESIPKQRLAAMASAAMLPAALEAAHQMALVPALPETLPMAMRHWQLAFEASPAVLANLTRWWDGYCQKRPQWSVALAALERLLP